MSDLTDLGLKIFFVNICDALRDLVPFVQYQKREKHPWRKVNFSKVAGLLKLTLLHVYFSRFLNCTNATKSRNAPHIMFCNSFIIQLLFE